MNTSYDLNSTPKTIDRSKYIESLMDFSTPMSTISNQWITIKNSNELNSTILDKLLQKFNEHKIHFHNTQNYLNLLDNHLREITTVLNQLQNSLNQNSSLKTTTDQLETRLLQMSIKREQIRTVINNFYQSPTINRTLDDIIHQVY
jgi:UDP-N-acetylglucosamine transferase subunit ALG13